MTDYTAQVQRGITRLEQCRSGSTTLIDLSLLDISADSFCAASQVVSMMLYNEPGLGFYGLALAELGIDEEEAVGLGFELPREMRETYTMPHLTDEYGKLTAAWHAALSARR